MLVTSQSEGKSLWVSLCAGDVAGEVPRGCTFAVMSRHCGCSWGGAGAGTGSRHSGVEGLGARWWLVPCTWQDSRCLLEDSPCRGVQEQLLAGQPCSLSAPGGVTQKAGGVGWYRPKVHDATAS